MSDKFTKNDLAKWLSESTDKILKEAYKCYKAKDYENSLSLFQITADRGDDNGIFYVAYMLASEVMLAPNYEKAAQYYQILAEKKNARAMNNLAVQYELGKGVEKNLQKAFELFKEATENGGESLEFSNLANCYFWGSGTDVDYAKALEASLKSCELGAEAGAYQILYKCYNEGLGTEKDASKAKYYRELALNADDITVVIDAALGYINESKEYLAKNKLASKTEIIEKLQRIIEKISNADGFYESYLLAEIYYALLKIQTENWKEHNGNALLYAKKAYEIGKELANHHSLQRMYGVNFFDFNIEHDYMSYDVSRFDGYTVGNTRITYVPSIEAKSNNYSIEYWIPRARLAYAMYCELENKNGLSSIYFNALSTEKTENEILIKNVVYPNALFMNATRYIMGYQNEVNEEYGVYLLKAAAERYHTRSAYLYGSYCQMHGNYEEAFKFYRIAISDKYIGSLKRVEIPLMFVKPGEKSYTYEFEYSGEKTVSYEAVEAILEDFDKYYRYPSHEDIKTIAELFLNAPNKAKNPDRFYKAFQSAPFYAYFDKFVEIYKDELQAFNTSTTEKAVNESINFTTDNSVNPAIDNNASLALDDTVTDKNLQSHHIWGYLKFNNFTPAIYELASMLCFPNTYSEKEICKCIRKYFMPLTLAKIQMSEVYEIIEYAKATEQYFKCGILLLSFNCAEGLNLLTKHYMNSIDNLLKISELAIMLYEKKSVESSYPYYFNKAMCLIKMGKESKGNKLLKDIVSIKHGTKLEKALGRQYQPAVDFLDGKEVNEEYLLNLRSKNG